MGRGRGESRRAGPTRVDSGAYLVALVREPDSNRRREHPRGLQATCDVGDAETRVASAKGRRRALRGWRDSRCGSEGDGRAGGVFVARTDVGGPAFAGVLVEEGDGWGGGIHGGCVSRVRSHCRAGRDENHESNAPSIRLPGERAENVRTLGADETAPLLDGTCHSYDTRARMCIEPLDTSECTRAMPRGASVGDEDGYAGIARARHETPAAWTHLPAERRSDIDVGVSEGTRASDGRTPVPATPASPK